MLDVALEPVGAISVLKLRGNMEEPDISVLTAYCSIGRSILVVDLMETRSLLPDGIRALNEAAQRMKAQNGRIILALPAGHSFPFTDENGDFLIYEGREQAIRSAEALHRDRLASSLKSGKLSTRVGAAPKPQPRSDQIDARRAGLLKELEELEAEVARRREEQKRASEQVKSFRTTAETIADVSAELAELIERRDTFTKEFEELQAKAAEERRSTIALLEVSRAEEAALRVEIAYFQEVRAHLEEDILRVRKTLLSSAAEELSRTDPHADFDEDQFTIDTSFPTASAPEISRTPTEIRVLQFEPQRPVRRRAGVLKGAIAAAFVGGIILLAAPRFTDSVDAGTMTIEPAEAVVAPAPVRSVPAPKRIPETEAPKPEVAAKPVVLRILNSTGRNGLAAGVAAVLPSKSFTVLETTNAPRRGLAKTIIRGSDRAMVERVRDAIGIGSIEIGRAAGAEVVITLGRDAIGQFRAIPRPRAAAASNADAPSTEAVADQAPAEATVAPETADPAPANIIPEPEGV